MYAISTFFKIGNWNFDTMGTLYICFFVVIINFLSLKLCNKKTNYQAMIGYLIFLSLLLFIFFDSMCEMLSVECRDLSWLVLRNSNFYCFFQQWLAKIHSRLVAPAIPRLLKSECEQVLYISSNSQLFDLGRHIFPTEMHSFI